MHPPSDSALGHQLGRIRHRIILYGVLDVLLVGILVVCLRSVAPFHLLCAVAALVLLMALGHLFLHYHHLRAMWELSPPRAEDVPSSSAALGGPAPGGAREPKAEQEPGRPTMPQVSLKEYLALSDDEKDRIQMEAYEANRAWMRRKMDDLRAEWLIIVNGEIVKSSPTFDDYPSETPMNELAEQYQGVPVIFVRSPLIEESAWVALRQGDAYPTLAMDIDAQKVVADFDTGAPYTLLDHEWLGICGVSGRGFGVAHHGEHLGAAYRYRLLPVELTLRGEDGRTATRTILARSVSDWRSSPWCSPAINPNRNALAGRDLLRQFGATVELDGAARTTRVRVP